MFDDADTDVIDIYEWSPPTRNRVRTEDLTMQTFVNGDWHRRLPDLSATACGTTYNSQFAPVRRESLKHPLCPGCFTPFELARADRAALEESDD